MPLRGSPVTFAGFFLFIVTEGTLDLRVRSRSPALEVRKCCEWGEAFDVDSVSCRESQNQTREGFLGRNLRNFTVDGGYRISHGTPVCPDSAVSSVVTEEFWHDGLGPRVERYFVSKEYCIDDGDGGTVLVTCGDPGTVCATRPCIRKCKPLGRHYGQGGGNGTKGRAFSPVFYNLTTMTPDESVSISRFALLFGMPCKSGKIRLDHGEADVNYLGTNGTLYVPGHRRFQVFGRDEFCLEYVESEGIFAFLCLTVKDNVTNYVLLAMGFIASCVCLLVTFFVYLCSRKSKSLYGKILMCYVGCLCVAYLSLAIVHLGNRYLGKGTCTLLGYSILSSFLAAFFWLNIMSIDIWKTFRSIRAAEWRTPDISSRFTAYSAYGWGGPFVITSLCGMLDILPQSYTVETIKPGIGSNSCWFSNSTHGMYVFFLVPVSIIVTCNIVLYVNTAWRCWRVKAEIRALGAQSGSRNKGKYSVHRDQLILNGKLFIVMGVSWGPEFLSSLLPHPLWKITDVLNTLLGVFIFAVFVLKGKTLSNVTQKLRQSIRSSSRKTSTITYPRDLQSEKESRQRDTCLTTI